MSFFDKLNKVLQWNVGNFYTKKTVTLTGFKVFNFLSRKHNDFTQHQEVYNIWLMVLWLM